MSWTSKRCGCVISSMVLHWITDNNQAKTKPKEITVSIDHQRNSEQQMQARAVEKMPSYWQDRSVGVVIVVENYKSFWRYSLVLDYGK